MDDYPSVIGGAQYLKNDCMIFRVCRAEISKSASRRKIEPRVHNSKFLCVYCDIPHCLFLFHLLHILSI